MFIKAKDAPWDAVLMGSVVLTVIAKVAFYFFYSEKFLFPDFPTKPGCRKL